jgi:hypothetical protein
LRVLVTLNVPSDSTETVIRYAGVCRPALRPTLVDGEGVNHDVSIGLAGRTITRSRQAGTLMAFGNFCVSRQIPAYWT